MARLLSNYRQNWRNRASFRPHNSNRERLAGALLCAVAFAGPLSAYYVQADNRLSIAWCVASPLFAAQGLMLLLTVPRWWRATVDWLINRLPAVVYVLFIVALGLCIVLAGAPGNRYDMGSLAFCLTLAMRSAASLTEPGTSSADERQLLWRLRRAAIIHAGFMPFFAFGVLAMVASFEHADGQRVPFTWPAGVVVATAAFIFKVHQRVRKVCTTIADRVSQVQEALADLGPDSAGAAARKAVNDLEAALRTPVQTGYHLWGTPIVTSETRRQVIAWLRAKVEQQQPVRDSSDVEYQQLVDIAAACSRWTDVAA